MGALKQWSAGVIAELEAIRAREAEEEKERFKQDLLLMGATDEEVEERYNSIWGNK